MPRHNNSPTTHLLNPSLSFNSSLPPPFLNLHPSLPSRLSSPPPPYTKTTRSSSHPPPPFSTLSHLISLQQGRFPSNAINPPNQNPPLFSLPIHLLFSTIAPPSRNPATVIVTQRVRPDNVLSPHHMSPTFTHPPSAPPPPPCSTLPAPITRTPSMHPICLISFKYPFKCHHHRTFSKTRSALEHRCLNNKHTIHSLPTTTALLRTSPLISPLSPLLFPSDHLQPPTLQKQDLPKPAQARSVAQYCKDWMT